MIDIARILRDNRRAALDKNPPKEPLIVQTGHYTSAVGEREILGVAIKAPFGSGKTFGVALKSYHDSRLNQYPMDDTNVIVLRARELVNRDEYFDQLIKDIRNVICGGLYVSALKYLSVRYEKCIDPGDTSCYTTLKESEVRDINQLLAYSGLDYKSSKMPTVESMAKLLDSIKNNVLNGGNLVVVYDEVEGFMTKLSYRASDIVYSNLAMMGKIHDQGIWGMKLVVLLQNKVIDDDWDYMIKRIKEGKPYVSEEFKSLIDVSGESSVYSCPYTKEQLDVSALMGRIRLTSTAYYRGNVYTAYAREAFRRLSSLKNLLGREISEIAESYAYQLSDFYTNEEVSKRFMFLESIAPRISFDYMDKLIESIIMTKKRNIQEALDLALKKVAEEWSRYEDIRKFYSKIIIKKIPKHRSAFKNVNIFKLVSPHEYPVIIETLANDIYSEALNQLHEKCRFDPRSVRYHSNHIAAVTCSKGERIFSGIIVLRTTLSKPTGVRESDRFVEQMAKRISSLLELTNKRPVQAQSKVKGIKKHTIVGLMLVPEEVPNTYSLELERLFDNALTSIRIESLGKSVKPVILSDLQQIRDEDFIIIAEKTLEKEQGISMIDQFIDERYKDIITGLAGKVKTKIQTIGGWP